MEMTIKAEQARLIADKVKAEQSNTALKEAEKYIRQKVQGKISLCAHTGNNECLLTYYSFEEEVYKYVRKILEENGYKVEIASGKHVPTLIVKW